MKEYLLANPDPENETQFRFDLNDKTSLAKLDWENGHEFWYNGELFDLIEKKTVNDQLVIRCINDKKEGNLVKLQEKISKENQNDTTSKGKSALLLKLIQTSFIAVDEPFQYHFSSDHYSLPYNDSFTFPAHREIFTPPPQLAYL